MSVGNPSSNHLYGRITKKAVAQARAQVASLLNASFNEIIFTSGGSESNNMVIKGIASKYGSSGNIITTAVEHPSVLNVWAYLEQQGHRVTYLPVDHFGLVSPIDLESAISDQTILVSIMHANNETGTIQPIRGSNARHRCFYWFSLSCRSDNTFPGTSGDGYR